MVTKEQLERMLKRPVTDRMCEIFNNIGIPFDKAERFRQLWMQQANLKGEKPLAQPFRKCNCGKTHVGKPPLSR